MTHGLGIPYSSATGRLHVADDVRGHKLPLKTSLLTLVNNTEREETFSVYYYAEPVLADKAAAGIRAVWAGG